MKKTYIIPASKVHTLQVVHMMALSTQGDDTTITEDNKDNFQQLGREDNTTESKNVWSNEW